MRQLLLFFTALVILSSCDQRMGSGHIVTEKRPVGNFKGISIGGAFTAEVKTGPVTEVTVEADDNVIGFIKTNVDGGILKVGTKSGTSFNNAHFKVYITAPQINSINSNGAANVKVQDQLKSGEKISFDVSGSGRLDVSVDAPEIFAEISGAGVIELSGRTKNYKAEVSGSGELNSGDLKSENTDVEASGAGNATVHASVNLKADASGAANIHYTGGANVVVKTGGAGNVKNDN